MFGMGAETLFRSSDECIKNLALDHHSNFLLFEFMISCPLMFWIQPVLVVDVGLQSEWKAVHQHSTSAKPLNI